MKKLVIFAILLSMASAAGCERTDINNPFNSANVAHRLGEIVSGW